MDYMSHRPSETPSKGIIVLEDGIPVIYPDRTLRSVHPDPAERIHAMSYRIVNDGQGLHRTTESGETWEHYRYTFTYRYQGRTMQITWTCGTGYGYPAATAGITSAFFDAHTVEDESFEGWAADFGYDLDEFPERRRAQRIYNACERMDARLDSFFNGEEIDGKSARSVWDEAVQED